MQQAADKNVQLVERIIAGDTAAESELVERYSKPIQMIIYKRTANPQLARDVCQEALLTAIQKLRAGQVRNPESLAAFVRQTAINISIQHFRKEKRYVQGDDVVIDLQAHHRDRKDAKLDTGKIGRMLDTTLDQLAVPRDREILRRFYLRDEDKTAICEDLSLSPAHFDRVLYRAKQRMRELIEKQDGLKATLFGGLF